MPKPVPTLNTFDDAGHVRPLEEILNDAVRHALVKNGGRPSRAARELGLSRAALYRRLDKMREV